MWDYVPILFGILVAGNGLYYAWKPKRLYDPERLKRLPFGTQLGPPPQWFYGAVRVFGIVMIGVGIWVCSWAFDS